jgi:hypothetical protein
MIIVKCSAEKVGMYGEAFQGRRFWSENLFEIVQRLRAMETAQWYEVRITVDEIYGMSLDDWGTCRDWLNNHGYYVEYV